MKVAELEPTRLDAVVLVDLAGRVDPGVGPVVAGVLDRLGTVYASREDYLAAVRAAGLNEPWNEYWARAYLYDVAEVPGGVRSRANLDTLAEDRASAHPDPYDRWKHLTLPTLLLRATQQLRPGAGYVVPPDDRDAFLRDVPQAAVLEVDANHQTINTHETTAAAISSFLSATIADPVPGTPE